MTSNNQGRFHFHTLLSQKQYFYTPSSYLDSESTSPSNPIHTSQKTAKQITPIAAVSECVRDSLISNNLAHSALAPRQTETVSSHENPSVLNIC